MGNNTSSPKSVAPELLEEVEEKRYYELLTTSPSPSIRLIDVNLATETANDSWRHTYFVVVSEQIPKDHYLILLFPNHQDPEKQVLYTNQFSKTEKLDQEINDRLCASLAFTDKAQDLRLVILCGNNVYRMCGLQGTGYLYWAEKINRTTINQIKNTVDQYVPMFVEMDGSMRGRSFTVLQPHISDDDLYNGYLESIPYAKCEFTFPRNHNFFTYEVKPEEDHKRHVRTMSREEVMKRVDRAMEHSRGSVDDEELPFETGDEEDSDDAMESMDDYNPTILKLDLKLDRHVRAAHSGFEPPTTLKSPRGASLSDEGTPRNVNNLYYQQEPDADIQILDDLIHEDNNKEQVLNNDLNPLVFIPAQEQ